MLGAARFWWGAFVCFEEVKRRLRAVGEIQFLEDTTDMGAHGVLADHKLLGDITIGFALSQQGEDLALTGGEMFFWFRFGGWLVELAHEDAGTPRAAGRLRHVREAYAVARRNGSA